MENLETPIEVIRRLATEDIGRGGVEGELAKWIIDDMLSEQGEKDLLAAVNQEGITRRHQVIAPLNQYESRLFEGRKEARLDPNNLPAIILERNTETSEGRLAETIVWCYVMSAIIRASGRENSSALRRTLAEDAGRMIAFFPNDATNERTTTVCRVVQSFWRAFFHETVRDPMTPEAKTIVKRLAEEAISLYEKSDGLLLLEIGSLLAETVLYFAEEERTRGMKLLRRDKKIFEKNNVTSVKNLLGFEDFFRHLEERGRPRKRQH